MTTRTYHGSCHCGAVRFTARLDLSDGIRKCDCTYCTKVKYWKVFSYRDGVTVTKGADQLADYRAPDSTWPEGHIHHYFCRVCGVNPFSRGYLDMEPFNGWFHAVNVNVLDDISAEEIIAAPVIFEDGRNDNQLQPPAETRHL